MLVVLHIEGFRLQELVVPILVVVLWDRIFPRIPSDIRIENSQSQGVGSGQCNSYNNAAHYRQDRWIFAHTSPAERGHFIVVLRHDFVMWL